MRSLDLSRVVDGIAKARQPMHQPRIQACQEQWGQTRRRNICKFESRVSSLLGISNWAKKSTRNFISGHASILFSLFLLNSDRAGPLLYPTLHGVRIVGRKTASPSHAHVADLRKSRNRILAEHDGAVDSAQDKAVGGP